MADILWTNHALQRVGNRLYGLVTRSEVERTLSAGIPVGEKHVTIKKLPYAVTLPYDRCNGDAVSGNVIVARCVRERRSSPCTVVTVVLSRR